MNRRAAWALLVACALGCASSAAPVQIPLLEATVSPSWAAARRPTAFVEQVVWEGDPADRRQVGMAAVGAFNARAPILSAVPIAEQVRDALTRALRVNGVLAQEKDAADYSLIAIVDVLSVREHATGWSPEHSLAAVRYDVLVRDAAGTLRFAKELESRIATATTYVDTTAQNEPALRRAVRQTLDDLFADPEFSALFAPRPPESEPPAP